MVEIGLIVVPILIAALMGALVWGLVIHRNTRVK